MPHIHIEPNQHDMTVSAWIIRKVDDNWLCMVHFHKKIEKYMQIGGHIELDETPWQSMAHELVEESGYELSQLKLVQHSSSQINTSFYVVHPTPFSMNTHSVNNDHYHSDLCYGFYAEELPKNNPVEGESSVFKWMTMDELKDSCDLGETLVDVYPIYKYLVDNFESFGLVPAETFSIEKPSIPSSTYLRGKPGEN